MVYHIPVNYIGFVIPPHLFFFIIHNIYLLLSDKVNASLNFLPNSHLCPLVHFVRVTYVRPKYGLPPEGLHVPSLISQKTFMPTITTTDFENSVSVWNRLQIWLQHLGTSIYVKHIGHNQWNWVRSGVATAGSIAIVYQTLVCNKMST